MRACLLVARASDRELFERTLSQPRHRVGLYDPRPSRDPHWDVLDIVTKGEFDRVLIFEVDRLTGRLVAEITRWGLETIVYLQSGFGHRELWVGRSAKRIFCEPDALTQCRARGLSAEVASIGDLGSRLEGDLDSGFREGR